MKKIFLSLAVICNLIFVLNAYGQQSAYYDAIFIYNNCFDKTQKIFIEKNSLISVLNKYYPQGTVISDSLVKANPFFSPFVPVGGIQSIGASIYKDGLL